MRLSRFHLDSYLETALTHRFADEWSRPGLTNFLGSVQADADPTGIRHPIFPPVSSAEEFTCYLTINDDFLPATGVRTTVRWSPSRIVRRCRWRTWQIDSTLAMARDRHVVVQRIQIQSRARRTATIRLSARLSGRCVNRGIEPWHWSVPTVSTTVFDLTRNHGLDPIVTPIGRMGLLFQERRQKRGAVVPRQARYMGAAFNAQCLRPAPDTWQSNGDAFYERTMRPGESLTLDLALALGETRAAAREAARAVGHVPQIIAAQRRYWDKLWKDAFRLGNGSFPGCLPDLSVPTALAPVAASAVLSVLQTRRRLRVTGGETFHNILTPRRCEICFYTWDWGLAAPVLARLEPDAVRRHIETLWRDDYRKIMYNFVTGRHFAPSSDRYSADVFSLFFAMWHYWLVRGASRRMLEENIVTCRGRRTYLDCMRELALDWRTHRLPRYGLADYGPKGWLLECVTTYAHAVAALNAGACWMLDRFADLLEVKRRHAEAEALRRESNGLQQRLIEHLYVPGRGYFHCLYPDGRKIECRHAYDLGMVLLCVGEKLPAPVQDEMVGFFQRELQTPSWVRALSPHDRDAGVSGLRADHQFSGSFCSWAALIALGLLKIGRRDVLEGWLPGLARTARQGPFGQAHWDERIVPPTAGGATKVSDELPQGCHWCDLSGALYYQVIEQFLVARK